MSFDYAQKIELYQKYPYIYELILEYYTALGSNESKKLNCCNLTLIIEKILHNNNAIDYCKEKDEHFHNVYNQHLNKQKIFTNMSYYSSFATSLLMYYYH